VDYGLYYNFLVFLMFPDELERTAIMFMTLGHQTSSLLVEENVHETEI